MRAIGETIKAILALLSIPLMYLNAFGGIVSGIWLIVLGKWTDFGIGLGMSLGGSALICVVLTPGVAIGVTGCTLLMNRRVLTGTPLILASVAWTYLVMGAWCLLVFAEFAGRAAQGDAVPLLVWAYANATGPWNYIASMERRNEGFGSSVAAFAAQLGCVAMMIGALMAASPTLSGLLTLVAPFLILGLIVQTVFLVAVALEMNGDFRSSRLAETFT